MGTIQDLVSVIIPVYNAQKYINRCVDSILKQDYENYEIILVNDGSSKECTDLLNELSYCDSRIKVLHQENKGVSAARNNGIKQSSGEWIVFVDADDYISPDMLSEMLRIAREKNADIVASDYFVCKGGTITPTKFLDATETIVYTGNMKINLVKSCIESRAYGNPFGATNIGVPWAKMYKRDIISITTFDEKLTHMEDTVFNINVFMNAKRIVYLPKSLYNYVVHKSSAVNSAKKDFEFVAQRFFEELQKFSKNNNLEYELDDVIEYKKFCLYHQCVIMQYLRSNKKTMLDVVRNMRRISREYDWDGKYNKRINYLYTKPQKLYALLAKFNSYGLLYLILEFREYYKN